MTELVASHPDSSQFIDIWNHRGWIAYLTNILPYFQYIRFVGFPTAKDLQDVKLNQLYVPLALSPRIVGGEATEKVEKYPPEGLLKKYSRLILLGDPGSGKSTLVNYLTSSLASRLSNPVNNTLGPLIPLPIILRDYSIGKDVSFEGLLDAFCNRPFWPKVLHLNDLTQALERGQVLIMLDGLDEIGSVEERKALRQTVLEGSQRFPKNYWLLTSRIVGYDSVSFDKIKKERREYDYLNDDEREVQFDLDGPLRFASLYYVCPFADKQIDQFVKNWYSYREASAQLAQDSATEFGRAIRGHETTHRLARTPNLLTLMALIYRVRARLPNGRALLYEEITEAYLSSIDEYRKIETLDYPFAEKKRWLARVGYELQLRRSENRAEAKEILAAKSDVIKWINAAREEAEGGDDNEAIEQFVDHIARRSGLLLPRGVDEKGIERFAFMHLSFQEYFAACFLVDHITSPIGFDDEKLRQYTGDSSWREPLIFLFELLAIDRPGWPKALAKKLFEDIWENPDRWNSFGSREILLSLLVINPHSGFAKDVINKLVRLTLIETPISDLSPLAELKQLQRLDLRSTSVSNLNPLVKLKQLQGLNLRSTSVNDLSPLAQLKQLQGLYLSSTSVSDLSPLGELKKLRRLDLSSTLVNDLGPLAQLKQLQRLYLSSTPASDLRPLVQLKQLQGLYFGSTLVNDLNPLVQLKRLQELDLGSTSVSDLSALVYLKQLQQLDLSSTSVSDLSPLAELKQLQGLNLSSTSVSDLSPLTELKQLQGLNLSSTSVSDLSPLMQLEQLQRLDLSSTSMSDLSPLAGLKRLQGLNLSSTSVSDLSPLVQLEQLQRLDLSSTLVSDLSPLVQLKQLHQLNFSSTSVSEQHLAVINSKRRKFGLKSISSSWVVSS